MRTLDILSTNESDNGMPYSFDADAQHRSSSMRQTWNDTFRQGQITGRSRIAYQNVFRPLTMIHLSRRRHTLGI